jgi:hypothetical protein
MIKVDAAAVLIESVGQHGGVRAESSVDFSL